MWGTDKEIEKAFKDASSLGTKRGEDGRTFSEVLKDVDKFNDEILKFARQSEIIDDAHLARLKNSPHYIPFYRDFTDVKGATGILGRGGLANVLNKKLKGAAIGTGKQKVKIIDHSKSYVNPETGEKVLKYRTIQVDAYPLKDLVSGYLENIFNIIRNSQRNRIMLNQIGHIQELIRQRNYELVKQALKEKKTLTRTDKRRLEKQAKEEIGENWAKKIDAKITKNHVNLDDGNIKKQFADSNIDISNLDDLVFYAPERILLGPRDFLVSKLVKGKRKLEVWRVSDTQPFLFESFNALYDKGLKFNNAYMFVAGKAKNLLTRGVTYDPGFFAWANFLRDTAAASILSKNAFIPIVSSARGFAIQIRQNSIVKGVDGKALKNADGTDMRFQDMWEEFVLNGGSFGSTLLRSNINENALKRLYKEMNIPYKNVVNKPQQILGQGGKAAGKVIRGYDDFVGMFEYASRLQEYRSLRVRGVNAREAAYQAREIATDFGMHGSSALVRFFTQQVPFLNAGLQGLYRTARAFEGLTSAERRFVGAKIVTALTLPSLVFRYLNHNNEEYHNLPQHVRDMNWTIPRKGGNFVYFPKPFEWGAMATVLERFWDKVGPQPITIDGKDLWWAGKKDFRWDNFVEISSKIMSEQLRLDITPQLLDPAFDFALNRRFSGSPITPAFMKNYLSAGEASYPWSNAVIVQVWRKYNLAELTTLSPIQFEHLFKTYTGAMGQYFLDFVIDPLGRDNEIMFDAPRIATDVPFIPGDEEISPGIFQDWNKVPLIKRMFGVSPQRHTQNLLDAYRLERELTKRINDIKKYAPGKNRANSKIYKKLLQDPYMQDILALDKVLASKFDKMSKLSDMETKLWEEYQKNIDPVEKGKTLKKIRKERVKISNSIIDTMKRMKLEYLMPTVMTLPLTQSQFPLRMFKGGGKGTPIPSKKRRTNDEIIQDLLR